eukprot:scaffold14352_cov45-Phaeocystis_antarctica.AAC.1
MTRDDGASCIVRPLDFVAIPRSPSHLQESGRWGQSARCAPRGGGWGDAEEMRCWGDAGEVLGRAA